MFIHRRFFIGLGILMVLFVLGFIEPGFFIGSIILLLFWILLFVLDILMLYSIKVPVSATRIVDEQLSMGDNNLVKIQIENNTGLYFNASVYDEAPEQLQMRTETYRTGLPTHSTVENEYEIRPTERGVFSFGKINVVIKTKLSLIERRCKSGQEIVCKSYPSIIQMKKFELSTIHNTRDFGIKKIRRLGHNNEFEQIKNYVQGDEIRKVNWKATSRRREIMINQFQEERSQHIYAVIDKSRAMRDPFDGLSLLDHSINSSLVFSNVALQKGDKVGLVTFSNKIGAQIQAKRNANQLKNILQALYNQKTQYKEANYELLYHAIRKDIKGRSLIMLYTNFDNESALKRALPILKMISRKHILVVIFFENTNLLESIKKPAEDLKSIYNKTIAEKFIMEKRKMKIELQKNGIQCVLTKPEELNVDAINKYLEIKSKGLL